MLFDLFALLGKPEDYVCYWSNGELYIKPATGACKKNVGAPEEV
jgi:hypothetical protein